MSDLTSLVQSVVSKSLGKASIVVQHKRMTKSEWERSSVILREGEIGIETDTGYLKVGDGYSRFTALKYLTGPKGEKGDPGIQGPPGATTSYTGGSSNGYVSFDSLTPSQKLQLKGDKGEKGDPGIQGPPGANGKDGQPGRNGLDGESALVYSMTKTEYDRLYYKNPIALYVITEG